jgi:DNA-directed RNA polymerase subunit beta'
MTKSKLDEFKNTLEPHVQNNTLLDYAKDYIIDQFPIEGKKNTLKLLEFSADASEIDEMDFPGQKEVKLKGKTWALPIFGHLQLTDNKTGKVIDDAKNVRILNLPRLTNRYSMIIDGSEYQTINQLRLKSGIYTRVKENGELESWFDLEKGYNFKMIFDPSTRLFYLLLANRKFKLYPVLRALGFPDDLMKKAWGTEIYDENQRTGLNRELKEIPALVEKLTKKVPKDYDTAVLQLREYLEGTKVDPHTTKLTLGESFDKVSAETLFATSKKVLGVLRGDEKPDERDSLVFKSLFTPPDLLAAYMDKQRNGIVANLTSRTDNKEKIRDIISSNTYSKPLKRFYTTVDLSSTPEQTNPVSILGEWRKTTVMGTGGVQSSHAITMGVRDVHPSHMGFLDAINTPESGKVGVTLPLAVDVAKVDDELKKAVIDSNGKQRHITPFEASTLTIAFPDQWDMVNGKPKAKHPKIKAMSDGTVKEVVPSKVDVWMESPWSLFAWPTNLIPFMQNNDAVRASFGSKMTGQALPLDKAESSLVESRITGSAEDASFENAVGSFLSPVLPSDIKKATVTKITDEYIHLKPEGAKKNIKIGLFKDFPLNRETFINSKPIVEVGDVITQKNSRLAHTNFQDPKDGSLAIGLNVNVAYMPWKGLNYEDSAVITESLAQDFSSTKIIPETITTHKDGMLSLKKFRLHYPTALTDKQAGDYDENGVIKVGATVDPDGILVAYLEPKDMTDTDRILRNMNKSVYVPYANRSLYWHGHDRAEVIYVNKLTGGKIQVHLKSSSPMVVGDKISGRHGNKSLFCTYKALTYRNGWQYIKNINPDTDRVATLNQETQEFEWQAPTEVHEYAYSGLAYKVSGGDQILLETTPDHRHYAKIRCGKRNTPEYTGFQIFNPEEKFGKRKKFCRWAKWSGSLTVDKLLPVDILGKEKEFFKWSGYFISGGHTGGSQICITQKENTAESLEIENLYTTLFGYCNKHLRKDNQVISHNVGKVKFNSAYFQAQFGHLAQNKQIPTWMKEAPVPYLEALLHGLIKGDGSEEAGRIRYFTVSKRLAEDVVEIGIKCGHAVNIVTREQPLCEINGVQVKSSQLLYIVSLNTKQGLEPLVNGDNNAKEEWAEYTGNMVCLSVPNKVFLVTSDKKFLPIWTGNSIVSRIIPDDEAPHTENGERIDLVLSPNSVPGRMNAGQLLETAAGKIAKKTGEKYFVDNFSGKDYLKDIQKQLKDNDLQADDVLLDGKEGKKFTNPIFNGSQYIMKLMHTVEHKAKARSYGSYSVEDQPSRGKEGGQKIDPLTTFALLSHGAKENMKEFASLKSQRNDEIWAAIQSGQPIPPPQTNFAFEKLLGQLKGVGVNVNKKGHMLEMEPMTDEQILEMSSGKLDDAGHMLVGKNLASIPGGLFDKDITGGMKGKKWSHIELTEKMPHPLYEKPIMTIFGLTRPQFEKVIVGEHDLPNGETGIKGLENALRALDVTKEIKSTKNKLAKAPSTEVNKLNRKVRYLQALKKFDKNPADVYMIKNFPIMPPAYRPTFALPSGDLNSAPINFNYRDLALVNKSLQNYKEMGMEEEFGPAARKSLYEELSHTVGVTHDARPDKEKKKEGILISIAGKKTPKYGYSHNKLWGKRQDLSARSTITLDPQLGLDEIGLPEALYKKVFLPFAVRELVRQGYSPLQAREEVRNESDVSKRAFSEVMTQRPVLMNRAPSLHKHSVQAHIAKPMSGSSIKLNPLIVKGYGADFDGDTMSVHVPVSNAAVEEAYTMLPSKNVWQHGSKQNVPAGAFAKDYMLGLWHLTRERKSTKYSVSSLAEANKLKASDKIEMNDTFSLNGKRTSLGRQTLIATIPAAMRRNYDKEITKKELKQLLDIVAKDYPKDFSRIIDALKDLALQFGHSFGSTISINDLNVDRTYRDKILNHFKKVEQPGWSRNQKARHWLKAQELVVEAQDKYVKDTGKARGFYDMLESGAESKQDSVRQLISMPGVKVDVHGKPLAIPITKSYAEGLDQGSYWMSLYGARKGMVDRAINTEQSGAINKSLLGVTKSLLIVTNDCGTTNGVDIDVSDPKNLMDRFLAETIPGVGRAGQEVTNVMIVKARSKKLSTLKVRSPLTCETVHGVCQKCYGIAEDGNLVAIGANIGIKDGQSITERSTQLTMKSFHSGGSASAEQDVMAGFPKMEQVLKVPEIVAGKATLAAVRGQVNRIQKSTIGGLDVFVGGVKHHVPLGRVLKVKKGDTVLEGDALSSGSIKPQELLKYKGYQAARLQMVQDLEGVFGKEGLGKRTFETVIRGIANQAVISDSKDSEFLRGDQIPLTQILDSNKRRAEDGKDPIEYEPYFKSIDTLAMDNPDWLSKLTVNRIRETLKDGASLGAASNLHGTDPMPSYLYGTEFGKGEFY